MILELHDSWSYTLREHNTNSTWFQLASLQGNGALSLQESDWTCNWYGMCRLLAVVLTHSLQRGKHTHMHTGFLVGSPSPHFSVLCDSLLNTAWSPQSGLSLSSQAHVGVFVPKNPHHFWALLVQHMMYQSLKWELGLREHVLQSYFLFLWDWSINTVSLRKLSSWLEHGIYDGLL